MPCYIDAVLEAIRESGVSERRLSIEAVGHESAIRSLKRGVDPKASTLAALCERLELEFYVGPQRSTALERQTYLPAPVSDVRLTRMLVAMIDAWERLPAHRRPVLAEAILGCIELSCPSEAPHPGPRLAALQS